MLTHKELGLLQALRNKKDRDQQQIFFLDNPKVIAEHIKSKYFKKLYVTEDAGLKYQKYWKNVGYQTISSSELKKISLSTTPQGAVAIFDFLPIVKFDYQSPNILLLDGLQDPGNVGTILRTADWFGIKDIFLSSTCADVYNPKTLASSMGSIFNVKFYQNQNLPKVIEDLKKNNYKIIASDSHGQDNTLPTGKLAIIIGSEAHGISAELIALADQCYQIPKIGQAESLNAAVATGIILYQIKSR